MPISPRFEGPYNTVIMVDGPPFLPFASLLPVLAESILKFSMAAVNVCSSVTVNTKS